MPGEDAGELSLRGSGMTLKVEEHIQIVLESGSLAAEVDSLLCEEGTVVLTLCAESLAGFCNLMVVMNVLDSLFKTDGDEQTDDDGDDVDEEVFPGVGGFVGWVDVEHGGWLLRGFGGGIGRSEGWLRRDGDGIGHVEAWRQV